MIIPYPKLKKSDIVKFLGYADVKPQVVADMTVGTFLQVCRTIYDAWKGFYASSDDWYQYDEGIDNELLYCRFKMMGISETAWRHLPKEEAMFSSILDVYFGGYHFEEIQFGGPCQRLIFDSEHPEKGCYIQLYDWIDEWLKRRNLYDREMTQLVIAYNACIDVGYYIDIQRKDEMIKVLKELEKDEMVEENGGENK